MSQVTVVPVTKKRMRSQLLLNYAKRLKTGKVSYPMRATSELKQVDVTGSQGIHSASTFVLLNAIAGGTENWNRIGKTIRPKKLHLRLAFLPSSTTSTSLKYDSIRILVVWDKQPNGALATYPAVVQDADAAGNLTSNTMSDMCVGSIDRFKILRDKRLTMLLTTINTGVVNIAMDIPQENLQQDYSVDLKGLKCQYNATGGSITTITTGALMFIAFGENSSSGTAYPLTCVYKSRFYFYDA